MPKARRATTGSDHRLESIRILRAVRRIIRAADIESRKLAAKHQITSPQLVSLMAIAEAERTTAIEVAGRVHLDPSTLVGVLDRLQAKRLIQRKRDSEDRRQVWIVATDTGRKVAAQTPFPLQHATERALQQMSETERRRVTASIERLAELMDVDEFDARPVLEIVAIGSQQHKEKV